MSKIHRSVGALATLAFLLAAPQAAQAQGVIVLPLPPFLPAVAPEPLAAPDVASALLDAPGPVDTAALPADIEAMNGGLLHVAGPVALATTPTQGPLISVPVAFAEQLQADEQVKVPGSRLNAGGRLYKARYIDRRGGVEKIVTAWCGTFRTIGLLPSSMLLCLEKLPDGRAKVYYSAQEEMHQELYGEWYAAGLVDRDWAVIDWPKLSPVTDPAADMTLQLDWKGPKDGKSPWLGWTLAKSGAQTPYPVRLWSHYGLTETVGRTAGAHTLLPGITQTLVIDTDPVAHTARVSGTVKP